MMLVGEDMVASAGTFDAPNRIGRTAPVPWQVWLAICDQDHRARTERGACSDPPAV